MALKELKKVEDLTVPKNRVSNIKEYQTVYVAPWFLQPYTNGEDLIWAIDDTIYWETGGGTSFARITRINGKLSAIIEEQYNNWKIKPLDFNLVNTDKILLDSVHMYVNY
jgi:hypothetical protein